MSLAGYPITFVLSLIFFITPLPPAILTFSYALPISEADTDVTEKFRFQIGTSF